MLYEDGDSSYTSGIPTGLFNKLHNRPSHASAPKYVALGSQGRYYVKFASGKSQWVGPEEMGETLQESNRKVRIVTFGEDWGTYFIVFEDGGWHYDGNIPDGLSNLLKQRDHSRDLHLVSLRMICSKLLYSDCLPKSKCNIGTFPLSRLCWNIRFTNISTLGPDGEWFLWESAQLIETSYAMFRY